MTSVRWCMWGLAAVLTVAACKENGQVGEPPRAVGASSPHNTTLEPSTLAPAHNGVMMGDEDVVAVLAAADTGEIQQGTLAQAQGTDPRVRAFGQSMVLMHTQASERMNALRQRLDITPRENPRSQVLTGDASATRLRLAGLHGADFDRAYVAAQVAQHAEVLDTIDTVLLPATHNPALHEALTSDVRPMVASHLQQARELQTSMQAPAPAHSAPGAAAPGATAPSAR